MRVTPETIDSLEWKKMNGMIPAIAQHEKTGMVLMMGWMNRDALTATLKNRKATFYSRKRKTLWCKGETSGNFLTVIEVLADCDQDTLLLLVDPEGPACHKGMKSCWSDSAMLFPEFLDRLIESRKKELPDGSYTASLFSSGTKRIAQKVGEEAVETALAAVAGNAEELISESADLLYHLMVLLRAHDLSLGDVMDHLRTKHASLQEKP